MLSRVRADRQSWGKVAPRLLGFARKLTGEGRAGHDAGAHPKRGGAEVAPGLRGGFSESSVTGISR